MPQLSTGLVIAGAYADKLRRVLFAQLREQLKKGEITGQRIAQRAGELNRLLFDILVNTLKLDKGDAVRIRVEYEVRDGDIIWKLDTLQIEAFRRIPEEEVRRAVEETLKRASEVLESPVSPEESEWTGAPVEERPETSGTDIGIAEARLIGETIYGERLYALRNRRGDNIGLAVASRDNGRTKIRIIVIQDDKAYGSEKIVDTGLEDLDEEKLTEIVKKATLRPISKKEAEEVIRRKMREIA